MKWTDDAMFYWGDEVIQDHWVPVCCGSSSYMGFQMIICHSKYLILIKVLLVSLKIHSQAKLSENFRLKIWEEIKNGTIKVFG